MISNADHRVSREKKSNETGREQHMTTKRKTIRAVRSISAAEALHDINPIYDAYKTLVFDYPIQPQTNCFEHSE